MEKSSKNYSRCENEPNQTTCKRPPYPPRQVKRRVFLAGFPRGDPESAELPAVATRHSLDKICLILTGEPGRALAYLYSEVRLYKGARAASHSQSTTPRSTGNISVSEESRPLQHTWNSKGFVLSRSNLLLHNSLHFQHLMKTKG